METRAHHVLIGAATLLVTACALLFGLWLSKSGQDRRFALYDIAFSESVSGLSKGSSVEYNGIKVGEVTDLRLDEKDARRVFARVKVEASAPVRTDTRAAQVPVGITGTSRIRFTAGNNPQATRLVAERGAVPVIVATPSPFSKLLAGSEEMLNSVNDILENSNKLLSNQNVASIGKTLENLEKTTASLADQRNNVDVVMKQLVAATAQAQSAFANMDKAMAQGRGLLDNQAKQAFDSANQSMASMERSMKALEDTIRDNRGAIDNGVRGFAQLGPALSELRDTLGSIKGVARRLEDRPTDYLLGREQMKEFTP